MLRHERAHVILSALCGSSVCQPENKLPPSAEHPPRDSHTTCGGGLLFETIMDTEVPVDLRSRYLAYLQSREWASLRKAKFNQDGYACQVCGSTFRIRVHHIRYRNLADVILSDLVVMCEVCHDDYHAYMEVLT